MSMNYIEFATTGAGEAVALKIGVPHRELFTEMEALRLYDGRGAVCLLDADVEDTPTACGGGPPWKTSWFS